MTDSLSDKRPSCNCTLYNGGQCYNCLNGAHSICGDGHGSCNRTARPSIAPSVYIERVKAWFYSKPRKQAQAAFTAGDERQIAYMLEDAEAKVLLANQAQAVVAMNSAAPSASGQIEQAKALLHEAGARLSAASYLGITAGTDTTVNKIAAFLGDDYLPPLAATDDRAARTEEGANGG